MASKTEVIPTKVRWSPQLVDMRRYNLSVEEREEKCNVYREIRREKNRREKGKPELELEGEQSTKHTEERTQTLKVVYCPGNPWAGGTTATRGRTIGSVMYMLCDINQNMDKVNRSLAEEQRLAELVRLERDPGNHWDTTLHLPNLRSSDISKQAQTAPGNVRIQYFPKLNFPIKNFPIS